MRLLTLFFSICFILFGCQLSPKEATTIEVTMINQVGDDLGTVKFIEQTDYVKIHLKLTGLPKGYHGLHIHEKAKCETPNFITAKNHFNPEEKAHGLLNPQGAHVGDLPNINVDDKGEVDLELEIRNATLLNGKNSLTTGEGTAIIITSDADDGMTQISGNSGDRIACGEIKNKNTKEE